MAPDTAAQVSHPFAQCARPFPNHRDFQISDATAGVPQDVPLSRLPEYFIQWDSLASLLADTPDSTGILSAAKIADFRAAVDSMPLLDHAKLTTLAEAQRGHTIISHITQTYVVGAPGLSPLQEIPEQLAIPYAALSERLGLRPVMAVANFAFFNWKIDEDRPWWNEQKRIPYPKLQLCHTLTQTERLFGSVSILSESVAGPVYNHITRALEAAHEDGEDAPTVVADCLKEVRSAINDINQATQEIWKGCVPEVFFGQVRTFIGGWSDPGRFPQGLLFRGVQTFTESFEPFDAFAESTGLASTQPSPPVVHRAEPGEPGIRFRFSGASAAQNPSVAAVDLFLGVHHLAQASGSLPPSGKHHNFIAETRNYMEGPHRLYLNSLARHGGIRPWLKRKLEESPSQPGVQVMGDIYNACLADLASFRSKHLSIATQYVVLQAKKAANLQDNGEEAKGTGGSAVVPFLKQTRSETTAVMLEVPSSS
ncbi:hypothetical protein HDU93_008012 [Gonapodya sp. JEL0774]|nr:hypothetical protein HDU93_008012 [Gonapodya sp. JEL0774]